MCVYKVVRFNLVWILHKPCAILFWVYIYIDYLFNLFIYIQSHSIWIWKKTLKHVSKYKICYIFFMEYNIVLGNKFEIYYKYIFQNQIGNFISLSVKVIFYI